MSYNQHKRAALDTNALVAHRMSHLRSCARHVSDEYHIHRTLVLEAVLERTGLDLTSSLADEEIRQALECLDALRASWGAPDAGHTGRRT